MPRCLNISIFWLSYNSDFSPTILYEARQLTLNPNIEISGEKDITATGQQLDNE